MAGEHVGKNKSSLMGQTPHAQERKRLHPEEEKKKVMFYKTPIVHL